MVAAAAFVVVLLVGAVMWATRSTVTVEPADTPTPTTVPLPTTAPSTPQTVPPTTDAPPTTAPAPTTTASAPTTTVPSAAVPFDGRFAVEMDAVLGQSAIYVADSATAELAHAEFISRHPDWSPDGQRVIFSRTNGGTASDEPISASILVYEPSTGTTRPVVTDDAYNVHPRFSPDGQQIAYITIDGTGRCCIDMRVIDLDGNEQTRLVLGAAALAWSPDGTELAYGVAASDGGGLWATDLAGNTRQILDGIEIGSSLRWSEHGILATLREAGTLGTHVVTLIDPAGTIVDQLEPEWDYPTWGPGGDILVVNRITGAIHGRNPQGEFYGPLVDGPSRARFPAWTP